MAASSRLKDDIDPRLWSLTKELGPRLASTRPVRVDQVATTPPEAGSKPAEAVRKDWSGALEVIRKGRAALENSEKRAADLESQIEEITNDFHAQIDATERNVAELRRQLEEAQARAQAAEARASDIELWIGKLEQELEESFARYVHSEG